MTAVYGRDGKKLHGFAYRNHIMTEHSQPNGLVSRYEYDRTNQDNYEPLAQVFLNGKDDKQYLAYFHTDQIGIPKEMTD